MKSRHRFLSRPIRPFAVKRSATVADALRRMEDISYQGRNLGTAVQVWRDMLASHATIFLGFAGAMVPGGMKEIVGWLMRERYIDCLVSTGANLFHDLAESLGAHHYKGSTQVDDNELQALGIDRIYDTFALEGEFRDTDAWIAGFAAGLTPGRPYSTREFLWLVGKELAGRGASDGILVNAYKANVPIYCPALGDSSYGIALAMARHLNNVNVQIDIVKDVLETTRIAAESACTGVVYAGGGTPKNFIQQTEVTASIFGQEAPGHRFAIQITQDSPQWGGLSGCTFEEAQSWGKIHKRAQMVTVHADSTIALPLVASALASHHAVAKKRRVPRFDISGEDLVISFMKKGKK